MIDKYYIPAIEDLFVGYQGEACFSSYGGYWTFNEDGLGNMIHTPPIDKEAAKCWVPFWLTKEESLFSTNNHRDLKTALMLLEDNRLRTPYLTKEQIEAEGWKWYCSVYEEKMTNKTSIYLLSTGTELRDTKDNRWQLKYTYETQTASITQGYNWMRFFGKIKSINEFRKISQYLQIK